MESGWLTHVNNLAWGQFPVKVSANDVDLMEQHVLCGSKCQDGTDQCELGDRHKSVKVVDAWHLGETLGNEPRLVADDVSSSVLFRPEDPLGTYDVGSQRCVSKFPSTSFTQRFKLVMDSLLLQWPIRLLLHLD